MQLFVTVSSKDILMITDGEGASLTLRLKKDVAQVLFISVPEDNRRRGRAREMLRASERLLALKGIKRIYADFVEGAGGVVEVGDGAGAGDSAGAGDVGGAGDAAGVGGVAGVGDVRGVKGFVGVRPMLSGAGFMAGDEVDIYALPTAMVLYDPNVKRALETDAHGRYFVSLADLSVSQMSSVMRFLESIKADISCYDIAHLEDRISGVVCDGGGEPIAMILCSDNGDDLHVDALISKAVSDSGSGLIAILGMISALKSAGAEFAYRRITMAGYNKKLTVLIGRTLSSGAELEVIGKCASMWKDIGDVGGEKVEFKAARDDFMKNAWERELIRFPLQKNVTWKGPWYRG